MNQIFVQSQFSPQEPLSAFQPGEAVVIKEVRRSAIEVIEKLDLGKHFSDKLMKLFRQINPAVICFAVDAATGYIHGVTSGKRNDPRKAIVLLEMIMRDKTDWMEKAYPMSMHCTPRVVLVEESNRAFRHPKMLLLLEAIGCELQTIAAGKSDEDLIDVLAAQIRERPVIAHRPQAVFDSQVAAGSISSGALDKLLLHMTPVIGAFNHSPSAKDGRTPHEKMADHELTPAPDPAILRIMFGPRIKRVVDDQGRISSFRDTLLCLPGRIGTSLFESEAEIGSD